MASTVFLKALGLNVSPNQLEAPEGSLRIAKNVVIRRNSVIEQRRGFKLFGTEATAPIKQLLQYKNKLLRHVDTSLQFESGTNNSGVETFTSLSGVLNSVQEGLRVKSIVSNGNLYVTSSNGIKKVSVKDGADLSSSTKITDAGGIKAINVTGDIARTIGNNTGFLPQDSAVAYRAVWGTKDANTNLVLGTPSQRLEIYNPITPLLALDFNNLLLQLDLINQSPCLITDGNYVSTLKVDINADPALVRTNLIALASKLDNDIYITEDAVDVTSSQRLSTTTSRIIFSADVSTRLSLGDVIVPSNFLNTDFNTRTYTITAITGLGTTVDVTVASGGNQTATDGAPIAEGAGSSVRRNRYTAISQPIEPSTPAANQELVGIQDYFIAILTSLQSEPSGIIPSTLQTTYIADLEATTTANVNLQVYIPRDITADYFLQLYRSEIVTATGAVALSDLVPSDELQLIYEAYPTSSELASGIMSLTDITPDTFRGANLYTNPATGEGILQANDVPPYAHDVNRFKNYVFYANTKTRYRLNTTLAGVAKMIEDYNNSIIPSLTIADSQFNTRYYFTKGVNEVVDVVCVAASGLISSASPASYFLIKSANNTDSYYVWYQNGANPTDPAISGHTGIKVQVNPTDTATQVAEKTRDALCTVIEDFTTSTPIAGTVRISYVDAGYTTGASDGSGGQATGFTFTTITSGQGERVLQKIQNVTCIADVANSLNGTYFNIQAAQDQRAFYIWFKTSGGASNDPAPTNREGIRVDIATNASASAVAAAIASTLNASFASYFTGSSLGSTCTITTTHPGNSTAASDATTGFSFSVVQQGALEVLLSDNNSPARAVDETANSLVRIINRNASENVYAFYLSSASDVPGKMLLESKNLDAGKFYLVANNSNTGSSFNPDNSPEFTISAITAAGDYTTITTAHNFVNGNTVVLTNTNSFPSVDGVYTISDVVAGVSFKINKAIVTNGTSGYASLNSQLESGDNEQKPNRIYYSKLQQPEAVPILNYLDVGAEDKAILRIFPLRDSLFVFKEDGLYRISGEVAPFNLALFDSSTILIAPDSVTVANNLVYGWTTLGIITTSESGVSTISRPIDTEVLPKGSHEYPAFKTATFGLGYESDYSYLVFTVAHKADTIATTCYRYSSLTESWTIFDKTNTCGIIKSLDDKLYLGAGDVNYIEQERKNFTRTDYADREFEISLEPNKFINNKTTIKLPSVTNISKGDVFAQEQYVSVYNYNSLLKKLDIDPSVPSNDYYSSLAMVGGNSVRSKLEALATKLDADVGLTPTQYSSQIASLSGSITAISVANPTHITCANHGLVSGRYITISNSNSSPLVDGTYPVVVVDANTFSIPVEVLSAGTSATFVTADEDIRDQKACYNLIVSSLNLSTNVAFSNYSSIIDLSLVETSVSAVNLSTKQVTLQIPLDYVQGLITVYKAIPIEVLYSPVHFQDPLSLKQVYEATVMFENKNFTRASVSFSSDGLPEFIETEFLGMGPGLFGNDAFGENFFGGDSNNIPMRTYIPRQVQRCRYINMKLLHSVAREQIKLYGATLTNSGSFSTRAYR